LTTWRFSQIGIDPQIWAWPGAKFSKIFRQARGLRPLGAKSRNLDPCSLFRTIEDGLP